ncbi:hypothetical protein ACFFF5_06965 [Lederbergia wuyishanensis]|uniref:Uncharacterized protein n=1 Tax=Lederbergia wuyishanensis TaxID=1347903 RepID=A0ABU0D2I3_9BACI|nr:hypothetical protein [Lederbergia wuyishanensis]MCJ8007230.1 hypothetical protein [Lederbergia wuyishanensis]MDQ0342620.1 hypothetical protein [Lederbergia wuyishanensis]
MNVKLKQLFEEDQHDLRTMPHDRIERDRERRNEVEIILDNGGATVAIDFIHAAIIYQHGEALEDWWQAYKLSVKAIKLGFQPKMLAAVAMDRWLLRQGKPLKYGNQVIPFGGVYRIPQLDQNTTDEERHKWDVPSLKELFSFQNLRGFMGYEIVSTLENTNLKVNVIKLERHPAHSPPLKGIPCETTSDNRIIYENSYGWKWVEDCNGSFRLGWLLMPDVPELAHTVADEGTLTMEKVVLNGQSCILVKYNQSITLYVRSSKGIWAITGVDYKNVIDKALSLLRISS